MATVPVPHQFAVGEEATATNINSLYAAAAFLLSGPSFVLRQTSATTSIPNNEATPATAVVWDTAAIDTDSGWSASTNPSRYTIQTAGKWLFIYGVMFAGAANGKRQCYARPGGSGLFGAGTTVCDGTNNDGVANCTGAWLVQANAGDYWEVIGFQNSGGALATSTTRGGSFFIGLWAGN